MLARSRGVVQTTASSGAFSPTSSTRSILRGGRRLRLGLRRDLGGVRDLPRDLDDVPVRVEDVELAVGAVAAAQDLLDAGELLLGAEVARVPADRSEERRGGKAGRARRWPYER